MSPNSNSVEVFFLLVRAGLFGCIEGVEDFLLDDVECAEVYQLAKEQSMVGLIADGIEVVQTEWQKTHNTPLMPREWLLKFAHVALQQEQRNLNMNKFVAELIDKLRKNGNYALLLKGQGVAQCYMNPLRRACCDVDLLLTEENYQKAKDYLLPSASFSKAGNEYKKEQIIEISHWVVELHGSLRCGFSSRIDRELDKVYHDTFYDGNVRSWMNGNVQVLYLGMPEEAMPFYSEDEKWKRKARQILAFILKTGNMGHNRKGNVIVDSYLTRKIKSSGQRLCDLTNHFTIFPLDTLRFFPRILLNGLYQK